MKKRILALSAILLLAAFSFSATVSVKTASYAVTPADDGAIIIFNSASNLIAYLPSLSSDRAGFTLTVQKRGAGNVTIAAQAADYVADSGVGQYVRNTTAAETYASITLIYAQVNRWQILAAFGTWSTDVSTLGPGLTLPVSAAHGGTGQSAYTVGDILYATSTSALSKLALGGAGTYLSGGAAPVWATLNQAAVAGLTTASSPTFAGVSASGIQITAGTGTGLTVDGAGNTVRQVYKVTVTYLGFAAAGLTADHVIATLPAKTKLIAVYCDTTTPYTGGTVSAATMKIGNTTGGVQYIADHDVLGGAVVKGLADADMGTELTRAAAIQGGSVVNWTTTTPVSVRLTTVTANTDTLTAGSTTFYLITERY